MDPPGVLPRKGSTALVTGMASSALVDRQEVSVEIGLPREGASAEMTGNSMRPCMQPFVRLQVAPSGERFVAYTAFIKLGL